MIVCSKCKGSNICEKQWHHVNDFIIVKGQPYHKMEEGEYFSTNYCDNDYQCLDCYQKDSIKGSNVINEKGE